MALTNFRSSLLTCGVNAVDCLFMGDSITEGAVAGAREAAYPQRFRDLVRASAMCGSVKGGVGYVPANIVTTGISDVWVAKGSVDTGNSLEVGLGVRYTKVPNGSSISLTFVGTGLDVFYTTGENACFTYAVDGAASTMLDTRVPGVNGGNKLPIRGLCEKGHTIVIKGTPQGNAYIEGAMVYQGDETAGIRVWESGHSGFTSADFSSSSRWRRSVSAIPSVKLVVITLGINDYNQDIPVATMQGNLNSLVDTVQTLLSGKHYSMYLASQHRRTALTGHADWSLYESAVETVAASQGCGYIKHSTSFGTAASAISRDLIQSDGGLHPTAAGHVIYAQDVFDAVAA